MVWCNVPEMWFDVMWWWPVRCGPRNVKHIAIKSRTSSHVTPPPFILHESFHTENHTTLHVTPPFLTISHISYHTSTSRSTQAIPVCNTIIISNRTISATLCIAPHLALHPILHYDVPHNATFHVLHATFQATPYIGHILHLTTLHRISHAAPHLA